MPSDAELQYYYRGFHAVLKRYRSMTMVGWSAVSTASAGVIIGWQFGRFHGLLDIAISVCAIVAGICLVQSSITNLTTYIEIPAEDLSDNEQREEAIHAIKKLMSEVEAGGWHEAFAAIAELRKIGERYGFPRLE